MTIGDYTRGSIYKSSNYFRRRWSGTDDPAHRAFNPYDCWIHQKWSQPAVQPIDYYHPSEVYWYNLQGPDFAVAEAAMRNIDPNTRLKAISKIHELALGHSFNAGVFAVEAEESLKTVVNTTKAAFAFLKAIKQCDVSGVMRSLSRISGLHKAKRLGIYAGREKRTKGNSYGLSSAARKSLEQGDISGSWLALQYGWLPLVSDVQEAISAFHMRGKMARVVNIKKGARSPVRYFDARSPGSTLPVTLKLEDEFVTYTISLEEVVSPIRQLGLDNWASAAWEVIPFSFVADWFIPIGTYLSEYGFWRGTNTRWQRTVYQRATFSYRPARYIGYTTNYSWGGRHNGSVLHVWRTSGTDISGYIPTPSFKTLAKAASIPHLENAVALIHQLILAHRG